MATIKLSDEALLAILHAHPDLRDRIASIAPAVENSKGDLKEADAAEERIVEAMRLLGRERCRGGPRSEWKWRNRKFAADRRCIAKVKKLRWHTKFGEIEILEPQYRFENELGHPFVRSAKVVPRVCSRSLRRAITYFAGDQPFAETRITLREHCGFEMGESTTQRIALGHAERMFEADRTARDFPEAPGRHKDILAHTDGGMVPIVEPGPGQKYNRKGKTLMERGENLPGARRKGRPAAFRVCGAGRLRGEFARSRDRGRRAVDRRPGGRAVWELGEQSTYPIDFYHVCKYLSDAAAKAIKPDAVAQEA
jgi:hypothetical protein